MEPDYANYRWKILGMTYVGMLSFALVFQSIPPLLDLITMELQITHAQAGLLMSLFALPGIVASVPAGVISDRFGVKKVAVVSLFLMIVGTFVVGISGDFLTSCAGRVFSGLGAITLSVVLPQLLSNWFLSRELEMSMGIFNTAMPLGTIVSFNVLSVIGGNFGWRISIFLTTLFSVFALFVFLWVFREPDEQVEAAKSTKLASIRELGAPIWLVGLAWMWYNAAFISFLTFAPNFFVSRGYEEGFASALASAVMVGPLLISMFVGYFMHKFGRETVFIGMGGVALAALMVFFPAVSLIIPMLVMIAIFSTFGPAPVFSLAAKTITSENLGLGFGILSMLSDVGVLVGPYLAGLARDLTGEYVFSFYLMGLFAVLQALAIVFFHFLKRKP